MGSLPLASSAAVQVRVAVARLVPLMVIHAPSEIDASKLAPLATPPVELMVGLGEDTAGLSSTLLV